MSDFDTEEALSDAEAEIKRLRQRLAAAEAALARVALSVTDSQPSEFAQEFMGYPGTKALWDMVKAAAAAGGGNE